MFVLKSERPRSEKGLKIFMAEYTNSTTQTVTPGSNVILTETPVPGGGCILHREDSGQVLLRGITRGQRRARFYADFGANVAIPADGTVGPISMAIALDGEPLNSSVMISTPTATEAFNNISGSLYIDVPCGCCTTLSVKNVGPNPVSVANASLIVTREA